MKQMLIALLSGSLFGSGLIISEMVNPNKVIGFLDIFGAWDGNLVLVMGSAVGLTLVTFRLILRRKTPIFEDHFHTFKGTDLDAKLIGGAVLFGIGWGLSGYCPGPAIVNVMINTNEAMIFLPALIIGGWIGQTIRVKTE